MLLQCFGSKKSSTTRWLRTGFIFVALVCFALSHGALAVNPPPDGGYAGDNTAEGFDALFSLTTGEFNTAVGTTALFSNTTGFGNTASGFSALFSNTIGTQNTATGGATLFKSTTGSNNTGTGEAALFHNTTGNRNTANRNFALAANTNGSDNTATSYAALNSSGFDATGNTATGSNALFNNVSAGFNTATGANAVLSNNSGFNQTATGADALHSNTTGKTRIPSPRPTGTFILGTSEVTDCPSGFQCWNFTVSSPAVNEPRPFAGRIARLDATTPIGMIVFFGGSGGNWWSHDSTLAPSFFNQLISARYSVVEVKWLGNGWFSAPPGQQVGEIALACRPATAIRWIHDNWYLPLGLKAGLGKTGFCITGNSAGSSQIAYSLANYGAYVFTDVAIASSGPPFMELTSGCLDPFTNSGYGYANPAAAMVDGAFGFNDSLVAGPCQNHDSSYTSYWNANGNENGLIYKYPNTRVAVIAGGRDNGMIVLRAQDYYQLLLRNGQSMLSYQLVPTMGHRIMVSQDGLNALYAEITQ